MTKARVQDVVREIDPSEEVSEDVEDVLLNITDSFVENMIRSSCLFSKHRHSKQVDAQDVQLHLEHNWQAWMQGCMTGEEKSFKKTSPIESHVQKLNYIKNYMKNNSDN